MAKRRATRKYGDLTTFFADYHEHIVHGYASLRPEDVRGELAAEIKLDLSVPVVGRIGPLTAQVVQRQPDGGFGLRLPDFDSEGGRALRKLEKQVAAVKAYLVDSGQLVEPGAGSSARVAELEARVAELEAMLVARPEPHDEGAGSAVESEEPGRGAGDATGAGGAEEAASSGSDETDPPSVGDSEQSVAEDGVQQSEDAETGARGIPVVDVSDRTPDRRGAMNGGGFQQLLLDLAVDQATGLLSISQDDGLVRHAYFHNGGPVAWIATPLVPTEVLGVLLMKAGQLTKAQVAQTLEVMEAEGCRQGEALIRLGLLSRGNLPRVLGRQCQFILSRVLASATGSYTFHTLDRLPEKFLSPALPVAALLFRRCVDAASKMPGRDLAEKLKPYVNATIRLAESRQMLVPQVLAEAGAAEFIQLIGQEPKRMRELFEQSPLSRQRTAVLTSALIDFGLLTFDGAEPLDRYLARVGEHIALKRRQISQATHFDVMELHWMALPEEVDASYARLTKAFSPESFHDLPEDRVADLAAIATRLKAAHAVLLDDQQRRAYRRSVVEASMIEQSAALLAKKGQAAMTGQDHPAAEQCFAKALELEPDSSEYRSLLEQVRSS